MAYELITSGTGFPGTNETLRFINKAINGPLKGLAGLLGYNTIVQGVELYSVISTQQQFYADGWVIINGEMLFFKGGPVAPLVIVVNEEIQRPYKTSGGLVNQVAYKERYAKLATLPNGNVSVPFSSLKRLYSISNIYTKLESIAQGAEVNVQPDWNIINPLLDSYIKNKPTGLMRVLGTAEFEFQTYGGYVVHNFTQNFGTTNYFVDVEVSPVATIVNLDATPMWTFTIMNKNTAGFMLRGKQISGNYITCKFKIKVWTNEIL